MKSIKSQGEILEYTFEIPAVHPSLNTWTRMHFHVRNKLKQEWHDMVYFCIKQEKIPKITQPVKLWIEIYHSKENIDLDNYTPKFICDPLRDTILTDDSVRYIKDLRITAVKSKEKKTVVHLIL